MSLRGRRVPSGKMRKMALWTKIALNSARMRSTLARGSGSARRLRIAKQSQALLAAGGCLVGEVCLPPFEEWRGIYS